MNALDCHESRVGRDVLSMGIGFYGNLCKNAYHTK